jgi:hypothetical protein
MTDPEIPARELSAASIPAAPGPPASAQGPVTEHDPVIPPPLAAVAPRRRWRWVVVTLVAVVVVAGLAAGLVVWAPWTPPPVLRPAGLMAGPATANSITFRWARPATGPLPDKYLILSDGRAAGTVAGTVTSYRKAGLTPASTYQYSVVAIRGGKRSRQSASLAVSTLIPPMSQARLQGQWGVYAKNIGHIPGNRSGTLGWDFLPVCATGPCNVVAHVKDGRRSFKLTLTRAGAVYRGHAVANFGGCGPRGNKIPDPATVKFRIRVKDAVGEGQVWAATSLTGTMAGSYKYVSSATFYCPASSFKATLSGTPD